MGRIIVTGAAGFLARRLVAALIGGDGGPQLQAPDLVLVDVVPVESPPSGARMVVGDLSRLETLDEVLLAGERVDAIFHLAAVVSAAAEADYALGIRVNIQSLANLLQALEDQSRTSPDSWKPPVMVFASSVAVFGPPPLGGVKDVTPPQPRSSYGTQKAIGEMLIADATRKGIVDGRCCRLPTIVVRPGKPNKAASSFASSIIREPLAGLPAVCPVPPTTELWLLSPKGAIRSLLHAARITGPALGLSRAINLPGITVSVREMAAALERHGGNVELISWEPDEALSSIVCSWPPSIETRLALNLGFVADADFDEIIEDYLDMVKSTASGISGGIP